MTAGWNEFPEVSSAGWDDFPEAAPAGPIPSRNVAPAARGLSEQIVGAATGPEPVADPNPLPAGEPTLGELVRQGFLQRAGDEQGDMARTLAADIQKMEQYEQLPWYQRPAYIEADPAKRAEQIKSGKAKLLALAGGAATAQRDIAALPQSRAAARVQRAQTVGETLAAALEAPGDYLAAIGIPSLVSSAPDIPANIAGALTGAGAAGKAGALVAGSLTAAYTGGAQDYEATVMQALRDRGVSIDNPDDLSRALMDPALMAEVEQEAKTRAAVVGAASGLSAGVGGKVLAPAAAGPIRRELTNVAAQIPVQGLIEGTGEASAQLATKGEIAPADVLGEAVGGGISAPVDVVQAAVGGYREARGLAAERGPENAPPPAAPGVEAAADDIDLASGSAADVFSDAPAPPTDPAAPAEAAPAAEMPPAADADEPLRALRTRIEGLEAERKAAISPEARKTLKADIEALQKQAAAIELEVLAQKAERNGEHDRADAIRRTARKAAEGPQPTAGELAARALRVSPDASTPETRALFGPDTDLEAPPSAGLSLDGPADAVPAGAPAPQLEASDGGVADGGSESRRADLERGASLSGGAGREPAGVESAVGTGAAAPAAGPAVAVEGAAVQPDAGLSAPVVVDETESGEPQAPKPSTNEAQGAPQTKPIRRRKPKATVPDASAEAAQAVAGAPPESQANPPPAENAASTEAAASPPASVDPKYDLSLNLPKSTRVGGSDEIAALASKAATTKTAQKDSIRYAVVDSVAAGKLKEATGLDVDGYRHSVDNFAVRHALREHGDEKTEDKRGQLAITPEDFAKIPDIVQNYDAVRVAGKDAAGNDLLRYEKRYNGSVYYVEEVRNGRRELVAKTLWKTRSRVQLPSSNESTNSRPERFGGNPPQRAESVAAESGGSKRPPEGGGQPGDTPGDDPRPSVQDQPGLATGSAGPEPDADAAGTFVDRETSGSSQKRTTPPVESSPAARPSRAASKPKPSTLDAWLDAYFAPGNIVPSYSGHDRVMAFEALEWGGVRVKVQAVVRDAEGRWVNDPKWPVPRTHETAPDARRLKAGPTESAAPWPPTRESPPLKPRDDAAAAPADAAKLADVGEKMAGARKDRQPSLERALADEDIAGMSLGEIWPAAEIAAIEDALTAAVATAARAEIPAKPRTAHKVRRWVDKVKAMRTLVQDMMGGEVSPEDFVARLSSYSALKDFGAKVRLLGQIERKEWGRIDAAAEYPGAFRYEGDQRIESPFVSVTIDGKPQTFRNARTIADVVEEVRDRLAGPAAAQRVAFEIRGNTKAGTYFINKVGDKEYRRLKSFESVADARAFLRDRYDEVLAAWEAVKEKDNVKKTDTRRDVNRDRVGPDHRSGRDVSADDLATQFGFRGIEFGNWVGQGAGAKERQGLVNQAYDALMDLSDVLGLPPKAMSLNGSLGMAFGSRGSGKAAAHFEPGNLVINLTKTKGAGALAHEWFHALDNYFARARGGEKPMTAGMGAQNAYRENNYITYRPERLFVNTRHGGKGLTKPELARRRAQNAGSPYFAPENWVLDPKHPEGVRPEVEARFAALVLALNESPMAKRAAAIDKGAEGYWSRIIERGARSFENYVIAKMAADGRQNDFLANVTAIEDFSRDPGRYPYLLPSEVAPVAEAMDALFQSVETRTDDAGRVQLFSRGMPQLGEAGPAAVRRARDELARSIGAGTVDQLERLGLLSIEADESVLPDAKRGTGVRGVFVDGVAYLFPHNISPGNAESVLLHEVTHESSSEDPRRGRVIEALGIDGAEAMRRFERLRVGGSRRDRALAEEAMARATEEVRQLRADGVEIGAERLQSESLAYLVELASAKPAGLSATMRKFVADIVSALKAWVMQSPLFRRLPADARRRLAENWRAADFVRAARDQARQMADRRRSVQQEDADRVGRGAEAAAAEAAHARSAPPVAFAPDADDAARFRAQLAKAMESLRTLIPAVEVGRTPAVLRAVGVPDLPITITRDVVRKATDPASRDHSVPIEAIRQLPEELADPLIVFDGGKDFETRVVLTELKDALGKPVIVALHLTVREGRLQVNRIASVYGKDRASAMQGWIDRGDVLYQSNRSPAQVRLIGLQLPRSGSLERGSTKVLSEADIASTGPIDPLPPRAYSRQNPPAAFAPMPDQAERFRAQLAKTMASLKTNVNPIMLGDTPAVLQALGARSLPMTISRDVVRKATSGVKHNVPMSAIERLPEELHDPLMVFRSATQADSLVVITEMADANGNPVVIAADLRAAGGNVEVNRIASVYGKEGASPFAHWIDSGLLAYQSERARSTSGLKGLRLPNRIPAKASGPLKVLTEAGIASTRPAGPVPPPAYSRQNRRDHAQVDFGANGTTTIRERGAVAEARTRTRLGAMIDRVLREQPMARDRADAARGRVRRGLLGVMTPRMIEESYGRLFGNGSLTDYVEAGIARAEEKHRRARESAEVMDRWQQLPDRDRNALAELMHDATLAGVRPNGALDVSALRSLAQTLLKKRSAIEAGMVNREDGGTDRQRQAVARLTSQLNRLAGLVANAEPNHAKLRARYEAMSAPARAVYDEAEATLQQQFDEEQAAQMRRIERLKVLNPETGRYEPADAALVKELREKLARAYEEAQGPEPYFPLKRFGDFVVRAQKHPDFEPGFEPVEFYESEVDAAARVRQLEAQGYPAFQTTRSTFFETAFTGAAPQFMKEALTLLEGSQLSDTDKVAIRDQFQQLYLKTLPDASALKSRIHRTGVPGFHRDAARSWAFAVLHGGNRIANLNHVDRMEQAIEDMKSLKDDLDPTSPFADNTARQQVIDEMQRHLKDTLAPQHSPVAFALQQAGFLWMLGGNVSTAMVNLTQTLQFTVPALLSQFNAGSALRVFGQMAAGVGNPTRIQFNVDGKRVSVDVPGGLSQTERAAYEELTRRGVISVTMAHDLAGVAEHGIDDVVADTRWRKFRQGALYFASLPQHATERMNREIAAMSFYRLARQAGKSHEAAIDGAARFAHETQFDYSAANRARVMRNPWVRVITLFKTYAANVIYRQWRDLRTALGINAATADERSMATRAFVLRTAMVGMTTGVSGIMGVTTVLGILDAVRNAFGDDDEPADSERDLELALRELAGEGAGDLLMHGALPRNVAERSNMSGLLLRDEDRDARDPQDTMLRIYESAAGPVGSILSRGIKGYQDIRDGDVLRGIGTALPNVAGAVVKSVRYASEGMLNRDGSPILEDLTPGEIAAQALGFTPSRSIPYWEEVNRQKNVEATLQERSSRVRNQFAKAYLADDAAAEAAAWADIHAWNERNPDYRIDRGSLKAAISGRKSSRDAKAEGRFVSKKAFRAIEARREEREAAAEAE